MRSDNGASYISADLAGWLEKRNITHIRDAPFHPQTKGKIKRGHQTPRNHILLENEYLPRDLEARIEAFSTHYNYKSFHESLNNLTSTDMFCGPGKAILLERARIRRTTITNRCLQPSCRPSNPQEPKTLLTRKRQLVADHLTTDSRNTAEEVPKQRFSRLLHIETLHRYDYDSSPFH